jgi:ubiquinone/menaquinone biosynthesis C-methylase UbiE
MNKAFENWVKFYDAGKDSEWPAENLVRLFKGSYISSMPRRFEGMSVCEVGFGNCTNLWFLGTLGLELSGSEVTESICNLGRARLDKLGFKGDLRVGTNQSLPFEAGAFDFLVSRNVLHYEETKEGLLRGIAEYARVLKRGGRVIVSTAGPNNPTLKGAETLDDHRYRLAYDDFRKGTIQTVMDAPNYAQLFFGRNFNDVMVGRVQGDLFTANYDLWLITATKP